MQLVRPGRGVLFCRPETFLWTSSWSPWNSWTDSQQTIWRTNALRWILSFRTDLTGCWGRFRALHLGPLLATAAVSGLQADSYPCIMCLVPELFVQNGS